MRVLADGCFDPIHVGHIRYFRDAASFGPPLIVRVAPDSAITAKGRTPFQNRDERMITVMAIGLVDRVCSHATLAQAVREIMPNVLVKGEEWRGKLADDVLKACHDVGAEIIYTPSHDTSSSGRLAE
jgi:cytidyltransferase-like protein